MGLLDLGGILSGDSDGEDSPRFGLAGKVRDGFDRLTPSDGFED